MGIEGVYATPSAALPLSLPNEPISGLAERSGTATERHERGVLASIPVALLFVQGDSANRINNRLLFIPNMK